MVQSVVCHHDSTWKMLVVSLYAVICPSVCSDACSLATARLELSFSLMIYTCFYHTFLVTLMYGSEWGSLAAVRS